MEKDVKEIQFLVSIDLGGQVVVRWLEAFGRPNSKMYVALEDTLEELHGVESVTVGRYSARLWHADHVTNASALAALVTEALLDANEFRYQASTDYKGPIFVTAEWVGHTVSL